jgi:hypothetical protein
MGKNTRRVTLSGAHNSLNDFFYLQLQAVPYNPEAMGHWN